MNTCKDCDTHIVWGDICADCDDARKRELSQRDSDQPAELECLEQHDGKCKGPVNWHTTGSRLKAFERCDWHQERRLDRYANSMERYADSQVPPSWFDPSHAGESWDEI